jgi:hypothetical protein
VYKKNELKTRSKRLSLLTALPAGAKIRHIQHEYEGVTTDEGNVVSPTFYLKRDLNVANSEKRPYQHVGPFKIEFYSTINSWSPKQDSENTIVMCKNQKR